MKRFLNKAMGLYFDKRYERIRQIRSHSTELQKQVFMSLIDRGKGTVYGRKYNFDKISNQEEFRKNVPLSTYETLKPYIELSINGAYNQLWPGNVKWYAKSSGTTDRSKYIPMTNDSYFNNHYAAGWDTTSMLYHEDPNCQIFNKKSLIMGGSLNKHIHNSSVNVGDVSAINISRLPKFSHPYYTPSFETALMDDWEEKISKMTKECSAEDVVMFGGVPTWTIVLFNKILEYTDSSNMEEVWPNASYYMHGGVGFDPYKTQFNEFFPSDKMKYFEVYNASEGYFAMADRMDKDGMLLMTYNDIYYEFILPEDINKVTPEVIPLQDVELDKNYVLVITTSSGLWRYMPGDTIKFTSKNPYRIKVSGRTEHFINVFGEEVMVGNAEDALTMTIKEEPAIIKDYTVGPNFMKETQQGGHQWVIEFEKAPSNLKRFNHLLDEKLQSVNSDYAAKRYKDIALKQLKIDIVPQGTFHTWMKKNDRFGGQNKVPRLYNTRKYVDELIAINNDIYVRDI